MTVLGLLLLAFPVAFFGYAYVGYPLLLVVLGWFRRQRPIPAHKEWPTISISLPAFNEAGQIREVIESLLRLDYPAGKKQILIISDASTDGMDEIVKEYAGQGVELLRIAERVGKTAAEDAGAGHLRGEIVVNTDASIRIRQDALKHLIARFADPAVGVASGRDLSVGVTGENANAAEAGYVGYEMKVRALETRAGGIIGASGCFYAIRSHLHRAPLPAHLSRDFASVLVAREHGYRGVSVDEAVCLVPRTGSLEREYRRKVRTISRGMETLLYKKHLLNPLRHGLFAWKLLSHKVCRWLTPCSVMVALLGLMVLDTSAVWARWVTVVLLGGVASLVALVRRWPADRPMPRVLGLAASVAAAHIATPHALFRALRGDKNAFWEPTRRAGAQQAGGEAPASLGSSRQATT
jgi:cellulose synthase/poly-beta-1,6-N-acetylglucosamine synthase-like glycosyltransferase